MTDVKDMVLRRYSTERLMAEVERRGAVVERLKAMPAASLLGWLRDAATRDETSVVAMLEATEVVQHAQERYGMYVEADVDNLRAEHAAQIAKLRNALSRKNLALHAAAAMLRKSGDALAEAAKDEPLTER